MEITKDEIILFKDIKQVILCYFNIYNTDIYSKRGKKPSYTARMLIYYILHCEYKLSISKTAFLMHKTPRNIQRCIANTKFRINHYEDCKKEYEDILSIISSK